MESSSFIPNPLGSPALMVLASTAENHEGARVPAGTNRFSGQEKETGPQFSNPNFTLYRPGEHFAPPIYAPVHPFVRPAPDRSSHSGVRIMNPAGSSAFRPVSTENPESYHSAFSPAKRQKPEDLSQKNVFNCSTDSDDNHEDSCKDLSMKDERPSSLSSLNYDTNSETHSETGEGDRGTPDSEGRSLRKQRKKLIVDGQTPHCPICGLTLRPGEVETHFQHEMDKLDRLSIRNSRKSRENTPQGRKTLPSPSGRRGKDSPRADAASQSRYENYMRIQCNRQARLGARSRNRKRKQEETTCPVCNKKVTGTPEELNEHVELCLKKRDDEEEAVDVEGEEETERFEEYTWAGQTRIRAASLLDGGFAGSGFQVASSSQAADEDGDLNVDDDDSEQYGKPQFSEADVIPCASDEPLEDREREALRGAVLGATDAPCPSGSSHHAPKIEGAHNPETVSPEKVKSEPEEDGEEEIGGSAGQIITALRFKLKEKERERALYKCLICMDPYIKPVISIQCWHVHCEECWLKTMGAKKLCPQCNMITSPSDLRRIFL